MASLKDMRNRIGSVKATQKITKAMQMVAAAKLRRAQDAAQNARPYAQRMAAVIANLAAGVSGDGAPRLLVGTGSDRRHLVLRDAEIHQGGLSTGPAGPVPARHPRLPTRHGLPLLPQLCGSGRAFKRSEHAALYELSLSSPKGQCEARAGAAELEGRAANRLGLDPSFAGLRFLQSRRACESRD